MISHEGGKFTGLSNIKSKTGIDELGALPGLITKLNAKMKFPAQAPESMEDDELCQVSTICMLLDSTIKHIADLMKVTIRQAWVLCRTPSTTCTLRQTDGAICVG